MNSNTYDLCGFRRAKLAVRRSRVQYVGTWRTVAAPTNYHTRGISLYERAESMGTHRATLKAEATADYFGRQHGFCCHDHKNGVP